MRHLQIVSRQNGIFLKSKIGVGGVLHLTGNVEKSVNVISLNVKKSCHIRSHVFVVHYTRTSVTDLLQILIVR